MVNGYVMVCNTTNNTQPHLPFYKEQPWLTRTTCGRNSANQARDTNSAIRCGKLCGLH